MKNLKIIFSIFFFLSNAYIYTQNTIVAEKEVLKKIEIGNEDNQIKCEGNINESEELIGIAVSKEGYLILKSNYDYVWNKSCNYIYKNGKFESIRKLNLRLHNYTTL